MNGERKQGRNGRRDFDSSEKREARELRAAKAGKEKARNWKESKGGSCLFNVLKFLRTTVRLLLIRAVVLAAIVVLRGVVGAALIVAPVLLWV